MGGNKKTTGVVMNERNTTKTGHTFFESTDVSTDEIEDSSGDDAVMMKKKIISAPRLTRSTSTNGSKEEAPGGWKKVSRKKKEKNEAKGKKGKKGRS